MLDRLDYTIVAIASAAGRAPLGIVRVSGKDALKIVDAIARLGRNRPPLSLGLIAAASSDETAQGAHASCSEGTPPTRGGVAWTHLADVPGSRRVDGAWMLDAECLLPAVFYVFRAPHSYTGEDLVEIQTVGNPVLLDMLRQRLVEGGAAAAEAGEFSARAFLHGRMTLDQAESVAQVIRAQSDAQLRAARRLFAGRLTQEVGEIRDELAEVLALVEAGIDFVEEPIEFITTEAARGRLEEVSLRLQHWLAGGKTVEALDVLPRVLLLGPPNAGKSTLLNALSGTSRAICAAVAGTTRDILTVPIRLEGGEALLLDSAGLDASPDEVLTQAREAALAQAAQVDMVCAVVDIEDAASTSFLEELQGKEFSPMVVVANKLDLLPESDLSVRLRTLQDAGLGEVYPISAREGTGLDTLRRGISAALKMREPLAVGEVLLTSRQRAAMDSGREAVTRAMGLLIDAGEVGEAADLLAFELREALDFLGAVSGAVTTEDLLGQVFARFCIGK